jgi:hypothetical protein
LHPRHKLKYFKNAGWESGWIETAELLMHDHFDIDYDKIKATEQDLGFDVGYSSEREDPMQQVHKHFIFVFLSSHSTVI